MLGMMHINCSMNIKHIFMFVYFVQLRNDVLVEVIHSVAVGPKPDCKGQT